MNTPAKMPLTPPTADELLALVLRMITATYGTDPSAPGVTLSYLPNRTYYAVANRYLAPYGEGRLRMVACTGGTPRETVAQLAVRLLNAHVLRDEDAAILHLALFQDAVQPAEAPADARA